MDLTALVIAMSIPSAITGFCFWLIERKISERDRREEEKRKAEREAARKREEQREKFELYLLKNVNAAVALGEATARAVQRIPDANCNGDMHSALEYAAQVKHEQKDFLTAQAIDALNS